MEINLSEHKPQPKFFCMGCLEHFYENLSTLTEGHMIIAYTFVHQFLEAMSCYPKIV